MLAGGAAAEVPSGDKNFRALIVRLVQRELRVRSAVRLQSPVVKQKFTIARALNALQELLGDDLVGVNVHRVQRRGQRGNCAKRLHSAAKLLNLAVKLPVANVGKVPLNGGGGCHRRTYQMGAPSASLAAFKIAIAGGGATLSGLQRVGIHSQAHGAARLAPLKPGIAEDAVQAFAFGF